MRHSGLKRCWIIGTAIIVATTAVFFVLPSYEDRVSLAQGRLIELEHERDMRLRNYDWFLDYQAKERLCEIEKFLVTLLKKDDQIEKADSMMKYWRERSISKLHTAYTDKLPAEEDRIKWNKMSMKELIDEADRIQREGDLEGLFKDIQRQKAVIGRIEDRKLLFVVCTGIAQVIGLLLINISQYFKEYASSAEPRGQA